MTRRYATETKVPISKSASELTDLLARHGATQRLVATDDATGRVVIKFALQGHVIQLAIKPERCPLNVDSSHFDPDAPRGWRGWSASKRRDWILAANVQYGRAAWRRLLLITRAKLEVIAEGHSTVAREFLADLLLPNGNTTVGEQIIEQLTDVYATNSLPRLMP